LTKFFIIFSIYIKIKLCTLLIKLYLYFFIEIMNCARRYSVNIFSLFLRQLILVNKKIIKIYHCHPKTFIFYFIKCRFIKIIFV